MKYHVFLFIGGDSFQREKAITEISHRYFGKGEEVERLIFNASEGETAKAIEEVSSFSLFNPNKVIVLRDIDKAAAGESDESENKTIKSPNDILLEYLSHPLAGTPLVLFSDSKKLSKRITNALSKEAVKELKVTGKSQIKDELLRQCKENNISLANDALNYFLEHWGNDIENALHEFQKVLMWAEPGEIISLENCKALIRSGQEENVWKLIDAISGKDTANALNIYIQLFEQGEEPIGIISILNFSFRRLLQCKALQEEKVAKAEWGKHLGISGYPLQKTVEKSRRLSIKTLRDGINLLRQADADAKGGKSDRFLVAERLVIDLCLLKESAAPR